MTAKNPRQWLECQREFDSVKWVKDWRKEAGDIIEKFESGKVAYNVLYANTETLYPALYSATPKPEVMNRFYRDDPIAAAYSMGAEKYLSLLTDSQNASIEPFGAVIEDSLYDALLPGLGNVRVKYKAEFSEVDAVDPQTQKKYKAKVVASEYVCWEPIPWNKIRWGRAKRWAGVPWVSFEYWMPKAQLLEMFDEAVVKKMALIDGTGADATSAKDQGSEAIRSTNDDAKGTVLGAFVFECWDKKTKTVSYVSPQYPDGYLKQTGDEYQLDGFFPCPQPLMFQKSKVEFAPVPLYRNYKKHAEELSKLTMRITRLIEACKARGVYDPTIGAVEKALRSDEGVLTPTDRNMGGTVKFDNAIWFMPIERIVNAIVQLNGEREKVKQIIYEVTGIADLIRGSSLASESATAQKIKNQWGTLRIKRLQREVQRFCKELFRMALDLTMQVMPAQTVAKMIGIPAEQMEQFSQVYQQLKDDKLRSYIIDIETDSTLDDDAKQDQDEIVKAMQALGQALSGLAPLAQQGILPPEAAKQIMLMISRRFKFGREMEEYLRTMQQPEQKEDPKAAVEKQKAEMEMQAAQQKIEHEKEMMEMERQERFEKLQFERERLQLEREKLGIKIQGELMLGEVKQQATVQQTQAKIAEGQALSAQKINATRALGEQKLQQGEQIGQQRVAQAKQMARAKPPRPQGGNRAPA